jgi:predicted SprT family Zn-dependent metalloprotease
MDCAIQYSFFGVTMRPTEDAYEQMQYAFDFYNKSLFDGDLRQCLITFHRASRALGYFSPERFSSKDGSKTDEIAINIAYFAVSTFEDLMSTLVHEQCHSRIHQLGLDGRRSYHNKEWANLMESIGLMPSSTGLPGGKKLGEKVSHYIMPGGQFEHATRQLKQSGFDVSWYDRNVATTPENNRNLILKLRESGIKCEVSSIPAFEYKEELALHLPEMVEIEVRPKKSKNKKVASAVGDNSESAHVDEISYDEKMNTSEKILVKKDMSNRIKYSCANCHSNVWGKKGLNIICGACNNKFSFQ